MPTFLRSRSGATRPFDAQALDDILDELEAQTDPEHPDVAVTHESGWTLSAFESGLLVWENVESDQAVPRHRRDVGREEVRRLFTSIARDDLRTVEDCGWRDGYGSE